MLRKLFVVAAIGMLPTLALAQQKADNWEFTLSGNGASSNDFDSNSIGMTGSVGKYLTKEFEVSLRQNFSWADSENTESVWAGSTRVAFDYHFDMDEWQPFVGANIGYAYGDLDDSWIAGLEGGVKYYVNSTTFIFVLVEYQFLLEESFGDGNFVYSLGIGFLK